MRPGFPCRVAGGIEWIPICFAGVVRERREPGRYAVRADCFLNLLEAAIGIEPMNKGFAASRCVCAQVLTCSLVPIFIGASDILSLGLIL